MLNMNRDSGSPWITSQFQKIESIIFPLTEMVVEMSVNISRSILMKSSLSPLARRVSNMNWCSTEPKAFVKSVAVRKISRDFLIASYISWLRVVMWSPEEQFGWKSFWLWRHTLVDWSALLSTLLTIR
jgi:hypothetical protein